MRLSKKTAVDREMTKSERNRRNNLKRITVSAIAAFILWGCAIIMQKSIINQEEKLLVYQVQNDIASGTKITEENIDNILALNEIQVSLIPEDYITDREVLINKFVNKAYKAKDIITEDGLTDTEKLYKDNIENPINVSFSVDSLSTAVSGTIREGDYINIYGLRKPETRDNYGIAVSSSLYEVDEKFTFKHVYIDKAFDSTGKRISSLKGEEQETPATMFSIILDEDDVELFNEMLKNCEVRLAKLLYDTDTDYRGFIDGVNKEAGKVEKQEKPEVKEESKETKVEEKETEDKPEVVEESTEEEFIDITESSSEASTEEVNANAVIQD